MRVGIIESRKSATGDLQPNTYIGGLATTYPTKAALAAKLNIAEGNISVFKTVGNDIEARIEVSYPLANNIFQGNSDITYYRDYGKVTTIGKAAFLIANNFRELYSTSATLIDGAPSGGTCLSGTQLKIVYLPLANFGTTAGNDSVVANTVINARFYVKPSLQTVNNGSPDGDLTMITSYGSTVNYIQNNTSPSPVTVISTQNYSTVIQLTITPPSSTNTIGYYIIKINGTEKEYLPSEINNIFISNLNPSTPYDLEIITVDEFYNKSTNTFNVSTNNTPYYPVANFVSYLKLEDNVLDATGNNNGVAENITYTNGLTNRRAVFNGTTSRIQLGNNSSLQLTNGTILAVLKTSNAGSSYRGIIVKQFAYGLFLSGGTLLTYSWGGSAGERSTGKNLNDGKNHVVAMTFQSGVTNGTKIYLDKILVLTTTITVQDQTKGAVIGAGVPDTIQQQINGEIDEPLICNSILTENQIKAATDDLLNGRHLM